MPNVSLCAQENEVHYNPLPYQGFCKLTLNDSSTVELEGSGELTQAMVSDQYKGTLVSAEIGELCTSIGSGAFGGCTILLSVTIPDSVTSIGSGAFNSCYSLTSVTIGNGVTIIGNAAFYTCSGLTSVTIPDSVTIIGIDAFNKCSGLASVTIGNGVTSIYDTAFNYCTNLFTITSHIMNAPSVNVNTFGGAKNGGTLYVPIGSSGYETWMNNQGNLGLFGWTKVEQ